MKTLIGSLAVVASLLVPPPAIPGDELVAQQAQATDPGAAPAQPPSPAPAEAPPSPPAQPPAPPAVSQGAPAQQAAPAGQWVYTAQYGWLWMPYGNPYVYLPPDGSLPDMYVYYPSVGWCWMVAPWIWGWGPMPYFGVVGAWRFGWWGYGFGTWYGFAPVYGYAGWYGGYWLGGAWYGGYWQGGRRTYPAPAPRVAYSPLTRGTAAAPFRYAPTRTGFAAPGRGGFTAPAAPAARGGFAPSGGGGGHVGGGGRGGGGHGGHR